jgi:hypothetical protein
VLRVVDLLALRQLEGQAIEREAVPARRLQGQADARARLVHRVRQEVDVELAVHAEPCRQLDRLDAAGLVEGVEILSIHLRQHRRGALAIRTADQRLMRVDPVIDQIHDRLKRHGEGEQVGHVAAGNAGAGWVGHRCSNGRSLVYVSCHPELHGAE